MGSKCTILWVGMEGPRETQLMGGGTIKQNLLVFSLIQRKTKMSAQNRLEGSIVDQGFH